MEEQNAGTIKKFSQGINLSMGYLLSQAIDRYLATGTRDIVKTSIGISDVERIVNTSIGLAIEPVTQSIIELEAELEVMGMS